MKVIGSEEMAPLYGRKTANAFRTFKSRNPHLVPPPHVGKTKWIKHKVEEFILQQAEKPKVKWRKSAGRRRTGSADLRVS